MKHIQKMQAWIAQLTKKQLRLAGCLFVALLLVVGMVAWLSLHPAPAEEAAQDPVEEETPIEPDVEDGVMDEVDPDLDPLAPGLPEGMVYSAIHGLPIPEEDARLRPVGVVINNIYRSLPQSGIAEAGVIYEVLSESDITRMVAIFQKPSAPKIGSVRSVRDYFVDFVLDYDGILVRHGGSGTGIARIGSLRVDNLDGMSLEGVTFWRDQERLRQRNMYEHSSFTGAEQLEAAINKFGFRQEWQEGALYGFSFNQDRQPFADLAGENEGDVQPCAELSVPFSTNYTRRFVYDPEQGHYAVFNRDGPHIDEGLGDGEDAQLKVANILVQYVSMNVIRGDPEGRRDVETVGAGEGLLFTEGVCVAVKWERESHATPTRWAFPNGQPMIVNPGATWICVLQKDAVVRMDESQQE